MGFGELEPYIFGMDSRGLDPTLHWPTSRVAPKFCHSLLDAEKPAAYPDLGHGLGHGLGHWLGQGLGQGFRPWVSLYTDTPIISKRLS